MDVLAVVPGPNMRYLAGLDIHMNERVAIAFFPADTRRQVPALGIVADRTAHRAGTDPDGDSIVNDDIRLVHGLTSSSACPAEMHSE